LVLTTVGLIPIEDVHAGMMIYSFDSNNVSSINNETNVSNNVDFSVSEKEVEECFVKESYELVSIEVGGEVIKTTPDHPFYAPKKGFTKAINLRAGDELCTVNGEYVIVERVQHEILESPVKVYNFRVTDYHTYFVGENYIGVHNACGKSNINKNDYKTQKYQEMLNELDNNKVHHIIEGSKNSNHKWEKLVYDKNWNDIKNIIEYVLVLGNEVPYKNVKSKIANYKGYDVQVIYVNMLDGSIMISDAWVID